MTVITGEVILWGKEFWNVW